MSWISIGIFFLTYGGGKVVRLFPNTEITVEYLQKILIFISFLFDLGTKNLVSFLTKASK